MSRGRAVAGLSVMLAGTLWGVSAAVAKIAFNARVDPLVLVQSRLFLSAAILFAGVAVLRPRALVLPRSQLRLVATYGLFGLAAVQASYFWAVSLTGVAMAIFLQYTAPILTAAWARLRAHEKLGVPLLAALGLCLSGLGALVLGAREELPVSGLGIFAGLLAALAMAFHSIWAKKCVAVMPAPTALAWGLLVGFLGSCLVRLPWETARALFPAHAGQALFIAVGATVLPFLLYLWGLERLKPTHAILLAMVEPVVGALAAWLFVGERLSGLQLAGAAIILVGVAVAERSAAAEPSAAQER